MIDYIGKYNLDYAGKIWDGDVDYEMLIVSEFDSNDNEVARKTFYLANDVAEVRDILTTEYRVHKLMEMSNNARIEIYMSMRIDVI